MFGKLIKNGRVVGYRMPEHGVYNHLEERKIKERATINDIKEAERALESWAFWRYDSVGFGDSNCNISDRGRLPACSRPPFGVELLNGNDRVIVTFTKMLRIDNKHREYVRIIYDVYHQRKDKESIPNLFKRIDFGFSERQFRYARKRFSQLFS